MIGDLPKHEMKQLLSTELVARIGCHDGCRTYVVPTFFAFKEGCLYGHSGLGMKVEIMRAHPDVCFEVDHIDDLANWRSIIATGVYEELEGDEAETAAALLVERLTPLIPAMGDRPPHPWSQHDGSAHHILHRASRHGVFYRIRVTSMTGRYERQ